MNRLQNVDLGPELPDDTLVEMVRLPTRIRNAVKFAGLKTIGDLRETTDATFASIPNLGPGSVRWLRAQLSERRLETTPQCRTELGKLPGYSIPSSSGTSHSEAARMISDGVQASMAPSAMACKVVMDCSVFPTHKPNDLKLNSELKGPN